MFKGLKLESARLKFRKLESSDVERLYDIYSDKEAMKFRGSEPINNIGDAHEMLLNQLQAESVRLGIIEKSENNLIGTLLLRSNSGTQKSCIMGFSFDKKYWNRGYGQETTKMLISEFQKSRYIKELKAWCKKENIASMKIFEKLEFSIKDQDEYPDSHLYFYELQTSQTTYHN